MCLTSAFAAHTLSDALRTARGCMSLQLQHLLCPSLCKMMSVNSAQVLQIGFRSCDSAAYHVCRYCMSAGHVQAGMFCVRGPCKSLDRKAHCWFQMFIVPSSGSMTQGTLKVYNTTLTGCNATACTDYDIIPNLQSKMICCHSNAQGSSADAPQCTTDKQTTGSSASFVKFHQTQITCSCK